MEIQSGDGITMVKPTVGKVMKFSVSTFEEVDLTDQTDYTSDFKQATYDADVCDNFILEMHYKVFFKPAANYTNLNDTTTVAGTPWSELKADAMVPGYETTTAYTSLTP